MLFQIIGILFLLSRIDVLKYIKPLLTKQDSVCMVVSEQENAKIYINGKDSHKSTPSLVRIPLNQEVRIVLKKEGFQDHHALIRSKHELTFYHCKLSKFELKLIDLETNC
jgi:hypothetical protein